MLAGAWRPLVAACALALAYAVAPGSSGSASAQGTGGPALSAPAAILIQPATRDIVLQRRAGQRRSIASTTKLMTALLALERRRLSHKMTVVGYRAAAAESLAGLRAGERLTTADLLRALLLASANDAAATIAADVGGSRSAFVRMMNERARRAGLRDTHFANPIGLDASGNYSTAAISRSSRCSCERKPFARKVVDRPRAVLRSGSRVRVVNNRNTLVGAVPWMSGIKTGHTRRAGYVLVGSATARRSRVRQRRHGYEQRGGSKRRHAQADGAMGPGATGSRRLCSPEPARRSRGPAP